MLNSSTRTLKVLAAMVWYSGAIVLSYKSAGLLSVAHGLHSNQLWTGLAITTGILIGLLKAKYLFNHICIKNLKRIHTLKSPQLWQFYRTRFYFFLLSMIFLGRYISWLAHENYAALISMAIVEISLATALLSSSNCFWKKLNNSPG